MSLISKWEQMQRAFLKIFLCSNRPIFHSALQKQRKYLTIIRQYNEIYCYIEIKTMCFLLKNTSKLQKLLEIIQSFRKMYRIEQAQCRTRATLWAIAEGLGITSKSDPDSIRLEILIPEEVASLSLQLGTHRGLILQETWKTLCRVFTGCPKQTI